MRKAFSFFVVACLTAAAQVNGKESVTPILPLTSPVISDVQITSTPLAEYPDICTGLSGDVLIAFAQLDDHDQEMIILKRLHGVTQLDSFEVSAARGYNDQPRVLCDDLGRVWVVWASKRNGNWDIYARKMVRGILSEEIRVTNHPAPDLHPSLARGDSGSVWVAFESLRRGNFDVCVVKVSDGKIPEPIVISPDQHMDLRPVLLAGPRNTMTVAWDRQVGASYRIYTSHYDGRRWLPESLVSPTAGFNMAPALAMEHDGSLVIAWQSNLRPDGRVGLTPWIHLVRQRKGAGREYLTLAASGDQVKSGEDQGFEFPSLVVDGKNRLWIFGRPSQGFFAQVVDGQKKSPLYRFGVEGWGGRGQIVRAIRGAGGSIYTVRRDLRAIYLAVINPARLSLTVDEPVTRMAIPPSVTADGKVSDFPSLQLADGYRLLFGDIHQHSSLSDGMGTPDECYTRSRFVMGFDFAALTDHEWFTANLLMPSEWEWIKIVGQQYDHSDEFVAFAAYEWTTPRMPAGFGHKNVYFADWEKNIFSFTKDAKDPAHLFGMLERANAIAVPHHIGWTGADWEHHDETAEPVVEIVSNHGAFEYMGNEPIMHRGGMPGNFIQDGLARGLRFGMVGSTDGHGLRWHHGIGRKENPWETGLAAAIVKGRSKADIFAALKHRHVYATSGTRIQMEFRIDDHWMGDTLSTVNPPLISVAVEGTARIRSVTIVRNNENLLVFGRDFSEGRGVRATVKDSRATPGRYWYYVRVLQEDGEMAWSSPVWVTVLPR